MHAMMRSVLSFFSMLALGVMTLVLVAVLLPWLQLRAGTSVPAGGAFQFESATLGLALGLLLGFMNRYNWGDVPRRMVTWVLIRERQFFYYVLIAICLAVLVFY